MVKIRLRRMGAKKAPYRVVVADSRFPRDGRFIEEIGTYNPCVAPASIRSTLTAPRWIKSGAQPTDTVRALLKKSGRPLIRRAEHEGLAALHRQKSRGRS